MSTTPFTDHFKTNLTAPLGKQMTQTVWDWTPKQSTFAAAWEKESASAANRDWLIQLADRYVTLNEMRPPLFYSEAIMVKGTKVADTYIELLLPKDLKMGGFDHGHFVMTTLLDIYAAFRNVYVGNAMEVSQRALALALSSCVKYWEQPNSYLGLKTDKLPAYGKARVKAMCIRALTDVASALGGSAYGDRADSLLVKHLFDTAGRDMCDEAQGDGLLERHWRSWQVALLIAALENVKAKRGIDTEPLTARFRPIVLASVVRDANGKPTGLFYQDVHEDFVSNPVGHNPSKGDGVELHMYRYLPADAQAVIEAANTKLPVAVRLKFGMPV